MAGETLLGPRFVGALGALTPYVLVFLLGPDDMVEAWMISGFFCGLPSILVGSILGGIAPRIAEDRGVPNLATPFSYLAGLATTGFIVLLGYGILLLETLGIL